MSDRKPPPEKSSRNRDLAEATERETTCVLSFLKDLKPVHGQKLKAFAAGQVFKENQLSRIRGGAPLRRKVFEQIKARASELGLDFPLRAPNEPLDALIKKKMRLKPANLKGMATEWGGEYLLFTRTQRDRVGIARLEIAPEVNNYGFPYFEICRRHKDPILIRGHCFEMQSGLYFAGFSHRPVFPRFMMLQVAQAGKRHILVGTMSASTESDLSFTGPCAALPIKASMDGENVSPGIYSVSQVREECPEIWLHLADAAPISVSRNEVVA